MSFTQYLSNGLSILTIGMCLILKFPQILKVVESKSSTGISFKSLILELAGYSITTCYNFTSGYSLLSYLEYPIILIQEYILIYLVLKYMNLINRATLIVTIVYFIVCIGLVTQLLPKFILLFLTPLCTPISASSKVIQLMTILRTKEVESVSPVTWMISVLTNLSRIFTIWMDSADVLLLTNFIISTSLSSSIMFAILYYRMDSKKE